MGGKPPNVGKTYRPASSTLSCKSLIIASLFRSSYLLSSVFFGKTRFHRPASIAAIFVKPLSIPLNRRLDKKFLMLKYSSLRLKILNLATKLVTISSNFDQKLKFWPKIEILVNYRNFNQKRILGQNFDI